MPQTWPSTLPAPGCAYKSGYASGLADPDAMVNPERMRRQPDTDGDVEFVFDAAQMAAFKTFFDTTCNGGAEWFSASWVSALDAAALWARFADGGYESAPAGLYWRVGCKLELMR